jgi:hypothetical protein
LAERALSERALPERALLEHALPERALSERSLPERALLERALPERALLERALPERALPEPATAIDSDKSATDYGEPSRPAPCAATFSVFSHRQSSVSGRVCVRATRSEEQRPLNVPTPLKLCEPAGVCQRRLL